MSFIIDFLIHNYQLLKALHIISFVAWMAGLLYLPRLFYYHALHLDDPKISDLFHTMERRLLRIIMLPAQVCTYFFGISLAFVPGMLSAPSGWFHVKVLFVLGLSAFHGFSVRWFKSLAVGYLPFAPHWFRVVNEIPTLFLFIIVFMVIFKSF
jgi:putative membrane protein